jgi:hypothetical protein
MTRPNGRRVPGASVSGTAAATWRAMLDWACTRAERPLVKVSVKVGQFNSQLCLVHAGFTPSGSKTAKLDQFTDVNSHDVVFSRHRRPTKPAPRLSQIKIFEPTEQTDSDKRTKFNRSSMSGKHQRKRTASVVPRLERPCLWFATNLR